MKFSRPFDGIDDNGAPITASRRIVADPAEKERILEFLRGGSPIRAANGKSKDQIDPSKGKVVPRVFKTDGEWIWTAASRYYLEEYGIAPEEEFLSYIESCDHQAATPDIQARERAVQALAARRKGK
ncbi:hypothetical protein ACFWUP_17685 [Nocardia sp. NPDC058658]|uniref:hypothetical protein n=1 Tax=Nocardia sp. NPDC058658 TaxID=3346580 RepID=UPI0036535EB7